MQRPATYRKISSRDECIDLRNGRGIVSVTPMWKFRASVRTELNRLWTIGLLLLVAAAAVPSVCGMPRSERHEQRHEIDRMEDAWRDALLRRDASAINLMVADDYIGISPSGILQTKDQLVTELRNGVMRIRSLEFSDRKVRFYGATALVTSRADVSGATSDGDITGSYRYTHVWVRDSKGQWRIASFEASRIR